jgi:hypothetical protein
MTTIILQAHSGWRWVVLLLIIIVVIKALIGWLAKQNWSNLDSTLVRLSRYALYIQVVLGVILYIVAQKWAAGFGFVGSHIIPALLAVGAVEFGAARSRKVEGSQKKFMFAFIGFVIAIVLVYGALATVGGIFG